MPKLKFTIDAALLRELGERLVGRPHIALAELIKNSYDADATQVIIEFSPDSDQIKVSDNGHGMTFEEFKNFWMRIGTTHKWKKQSRGFNRAMTGSKGIGRLAVQFLATRLEIKTVSSDARGNWLEAQANWLETANAKELSEATVEYNLSGATTPFPHGTSIILNGLKGEWTTESVRKLASELWWLQPPFTSSSSDLTHSNVEFRVDFQASHHNYAQEFLNQMNAIKRIWIARIVGKNVDGKVRLSLEFPGDQPTINKYNIADFSHNLGQYDKNNNLNNAHFEIRIYNLSGRQRFGIEVKKARKYFEEHGGVHVYDGGFRLPYYGLPTSDWLKLEYDHSHRKTVSQYFPREIQVHRALNDLPTLGRVLGEVNVDTSREHNLKIMITRDRLTETRAYDDLVSIVRHAIDWYAIETARRKFEAKKREAPPEPTSQRLVKIEQVLEQYEPEIPKNVYHEVHEEVQKVITTVKTNQEFVIEQMALLAPLATAGISALSYQHELKKQFAFVESIIDSMTGIQTEDRGLRQDLISLSGDLKLWLERAKATNGLFDYIADAENTKLRFRLRANSVIHDIVTQTRFLARDIKVDFSQLEDELFLPKASFAEWGAIFQNIFTNSFNAMLDSSERLLHISSQSKQKSREILIQDTGHGINVEESDRYFNPFERASSVSPERQALGYGGTGLGLTIVRLLADNIGCRVQFVPPHSGFRTAFSIQWRESK